MAHAYEHSLSAVRQWSGKPEDYMPINEFLDATKTYIHHSIHRLYRHHSEGIAEVEKVFGPFIINSDGKRVYTKYIAQRHIEEDCNGRVPNACEYIEALISGKIPKWMRTTIKIEEINEKREKRNREDRDTE